MRVSFNISISITIDIPPTIPPLVCDTSGVPTSGKVGETFSGKLAVSGGTPPYTFQLDTPLPDGLTLSEDGSITGTPTKDGSFSVTGSVSDAQSV